MFYHDVVNMARIEIVVVASDVKKRSPKNRHCKVNTINIKMFYHLVCKIFFSSFCGACVYILL